MPENTFRPGARVVSNRRNLFRSLFATAVLLGGVLLCQAQQVRPAPPQAAAKPTAAPAAPPAGSGYVGSDTCKTCHEDIYKAGFQSTPHYNLIKEGKHGCEDCHGPGQAHVEAGGDPAKIRRFTKLSTAEASRICLDCHQTHGLEQSNFPRSAHAKNNVGCLDCHSPHHATQPEFLLTKSQPQLCYGCHAPVKAEFNRPFRHRVEVHLIECSDCHNPHGSFIAHQLRLASTQQQICTRCHTEKQGPFVFEHAPVKQEGCTSCHLPHGANNPRLLRVNEVNLLCLQCHTPTMNNPIPGTPTFHNQAQKYQACTLCHTQIHGSNFNEFFFK